MTDPMLTRHKVRLAAFQLTPDGDWYGVIEVAPEPGYWVGCHWLTQFQGPTLDDVTAQAKKWHEGGGLDTDNAAEEAKQAHWDSTMSRVDLA